MLEFIKMFGLGILYTILSPVILLIFLLFVAYSFINYLVCEAIYLGGFFLGKRFVAETELDKQLLKIKEEKKREAEEAMHNISSQNEGGDLNA